MSESKKHIGFKFGGSSITYSPKTKNGAKPSQRAQPSSSLGKRHRSHAFEPDSDAEEDEFSGKQEAVTILGSEDERQTIRSGAKLSGTESTAITIHCQTSELDNKIKSRKVRDGKHDPFKETVPAEKDKGLTWGLNTTKKAGTERFSADASGDTTSDHQDRRQDVEQNVEQKPDALKGDIDQNAMDILLGKDNRQKLVITEDDALKRDSQVAGEVSTIEEYDKIPDGEFGAAMLRGMGWDGKTTGAAYAQRAKRAKHLGLGAKEDEEIKKLELQKKQGHRSRPPKLDEYRRSEEMKRQRREERHQDSYKNERERERTSHRRYDDRDQDRDRRRDRDHHRHRDRGSRR